MDKKILLAAIVTIFIGEILLGLFLLNKNSNKDAGEFKLSDYQSFINNFPSEKMVDAIGSAAEAKKQAEKLWVEIYGESVKDNKPYIVLYDSANKVWLVKGSIPKNTIGGVPNILIQADGKVLAVWHDK